MKKRKAFKDYVVYNVCEERGISAKTGNYRPKFEELLQDIRDKKVNTIVVLKLDRLTRSVADWEKILTFLEENDAYLDCVNNDINTTNANGKMISRILISVSQQEIERTSEGTKIGLAGVIKVGHIPHQAPLGYKHEDKKLVIDYAIKDVVIRIFNWRDSTIFNLLTNEIYKGDFVYGKRTKKPTYYNDVVEPLVSKEFWEECQIQKKKNQRSYQRKLTYLFMQKLKCPQCKRILGGKATTKKNNNSYYYYYCNDCKITYKENEIEKIIDEYMDSIVEYDSIVNQFFYLQDLSVSLKDISIELSESKETIKILPESNNALELRSTKLKEEKNKLKSRNSSLENELKNLKEIVEIFKNKLERLYHFFVDKMWGDKEKRDKYYPVAYELYGKNILDEEQIRGILGTKQRSAEIDNESKSRDDDMEL